MPSNAYRDWTTYRSGELDEIVRAHTAVGGSGRGGRRETQQINRSYAVLLAAHFQGFCRDLHTECVDRLAESLASVLQPIVAREFTLNRQLDRGNAQASSIGADFGRLGIEFWEEIDAQDAGGPARRTAIGDLNRWRNAIVHQDLDPAKLGGSTTLHLSTVRGWRRDCSRLARSFDVVMKDHTTGLAGKSPW